MANRLELSYESYRFERNHTFDPDPPDDPLFPVLDITVNVARLVGTAAFDSRDDLFDSRRGSLPPRAWSTRRKRWARPRASRS